MNNPHETIEQKAITGAPVGNKLENLIDGGGVREIVKEVAVSFISCANAANGLLPFLQTRNVDFNNEGIYKLKYSLLKDVCNLMESLGAKYLNFNFVEINPKHENLDLESYAGSNSIIYMIATLKRDEDNHFENQHYLLLNAKDSHLLSDQNMTDQEKCPLENKFLKKSYGIFKEYYMYMNNENTQSIDYHIVDIKETLDKEEGKCDVFRVHLCQISNVAEVINEILPGVKLGDEYETHFKNREKQTTLVFHGSGDNYYDMGSLRP